MIILLQEELAIPAKVIFLEKLFKLLEKLSILSILLVEIVELL